MGKKIISNKNKGILFWITGLSGSGKTAIAKKIYKKISHLYGPTIEISGDDFRKIFRLNKYTKKARIEYLPKYLHFCKLITDQKINLILCDFFSEYKAKNAQNRVTIKEKLNAAEKNRFKELITDNSNFKLLNIMSNLCYKKIKKDQKGLGVFMDILFRSCEQ